MSQLGKGGKGGGVISYRVEFQGRGAAHIHGTLWLNIKEIEKLPQFTEDKQENGKLTEAFRKFRADEELTESEKEGLFALKGHAKVGGVRASLYNAMPLEGVLELAQFMQEFERKNG